MNQTTSGKKIDTVDTPAEKIKKGNEILVNGFGGDIFTVKLVKVDQVDHYPHLQKVVIKWGSCVWHLKQGQSVPKVKRPARKKKA